MNYEHMWQLLKKNLRTCIHDRKHKQREKTRPDFELYRFYEKEIQVMEAVLLLMTGIEYTEKNKEEGSANNEI